MIKVRSLLFLFLVLCVLSSCGKKTPEAVRPEERQKPAVRLIAILPVDNRSSDSQAARILREKVLEEVYFRGYPKIPLTVVDDKISKYYRGGHIPPGIVGELLGVDAVFYSTLLEWKTSYLYVYARTIVSAKFELRNAKTGETIWKGSRQVSKKNYDVTRKGLEIKSFLDYEPAIQEVVDSAMKTFPDGPDFIGRPPPKGGCILWNWF